MEHYGNCSKNYINCRKHPARTGAPAVRVNADFKAYRIKVESDLFEKEAKLAEMEKDSNIKAGTLKRVKKEVEEARTLQISTLNKTAYDAWLEQQNAIIQEKHDNKEPTRSLVQNLNTIAGKRGSIIDGIKANVEKEVFLNKVNQEPLDGFKKAMANVLIQHGSAYQTESRSWGDTRGNADYEATEHLRNKCEPVAIKDYQEDYTWSIYDTYNNESEHGIRAHITCKCGEVYNKPFILENQGFSSVLELLMNS